MTLGVYVTQLSLIWVPLQCVHPRGHTALRATGAGCRDAYTTSGRREGWPLAREESQPPTSTTSSFESEEEWTSLGTHEVPPGSRVTAANRARLPPGSQGPSICAVGCVCVCGGGVNTQIGPLERPACPLSGWLPPGPASCDTHS